MLWLWAVASRKHQKVHLFFLEDKVAKHKESPKVLFYIQAGKGEAGKEYY